MKHRITFLFSFHSNCLKAFKVIIGNFKRKYFFYKLLRKIENKFLTESYSSRVFLSSLMSTMNDINLSFNKKIMANYG